MNDFAKRLWLTLGADKKKLGIMVGLLCVGLLLWGRLLLQPVPRTATADPQVKAKQLAGASTAAIAVVPPPIEADLGQPSGQTNGVMPVKLDKPNRLDRNLFHWNRSPYRQVKSADVKPQPKQPKRNEPERSVRIAQVRNAGRQLDLQGIFTGTRRRAIINGRLLRVGQTIKTFTVVKIATGYVDLKMSGIKLRLRR